MAILGSGARGGIISSTSPIQWWINGGLSDINFIDRGSLLWGVSKWCSLGRPCFNPGIIVVEFGGRSMDKRQCNALSAFGTAKQMPQRSHVRLI